MRRFLALVLWILFVAVVSADKKKEEPKWDVTDEVQEGDDLKITIGNVLDKVIVTLWMKNIRHQWEQNKKNERVRDTLKELIKTHYKDFVIYTEADVSLYNINAYTFEDQAKEWGVQLDRLNDGPLVMVLYKKEGGEYWGTNNTMTLSLVKKVDKEIRDLRQRQINKEGLKDKKGKPLQPPKPANVKAIFDKLGEYDVHDPWQEYSHFRPGTPSPAHLQRLERAGVKPPPPPPPPK